MYNYSIVWHNSDAVDTAALEPQVIQDLVNNIGEDILLDPSRLITHTVFLSDNMDSGPVVALWGEPDDNRLHCEYIETITWITLEQMNSDE